MHRRLNSLVLLLVVGLIAGSAVAIALRPTVLGLDLKGGTELVYQAKPTRGAPLTSDNIQRSIDVMNSRVNQLGVSSTTVQRSGPDQIDVQLPDVSNTAKAIAEVGRVAQLHFYDWESNVIGANGQPVCSPTSCPAGILTSANATGDQSSGGPGGIGAGLTEYDAVLRAAQRQPTNLKTATTNGQYYLVLDAKQRVLAGPEDTVAALYVDYRDAHRQQRPPAAARAVQVDIGTILLRAVTPAGYRGPPLNSWYVINDDPVLSGKDIANPQEQSDNGPGGNGQPSVTFNFNGGAGGIFQNVTRQIADRGRNSVLPGVSSQSALQHFAIALDGQLITVPSIDFNQYPDGIDPTNGSQITGSFTIDTANQLADELRSGALPLKLTLISESQVSATLGKQALHQGLIAGLLGFAVVCLFLVAFYRVLGLIAVGGLLIYAAYFFALIKLIPITVTLPGIAGLILTIGVAADANIVIFERIKEEIRTGRSIPVAISNGYRHGINAIIDANVVTFLTAFILFAISTAGVKGFAFTLGIGTIVSLFTAVLATQAALGAMGRSRAIGSAGLLGVSAARRRLTFDFMGRSKLFFTLSGTILLAGAIGIGARGVHFGIDFQSGTRIETGFAKPTTVAAVRDEMGRLGFGDAIVVSVPHDSNVGGGTGYQISVSQLPLSCSSTAKSCRDVSSVKSGLDDAFGIGNPSSSSFVPGTRSFNNTTIGPTFGATIANAAVVAIIASLLVISAYIALRFEWKYAIPVLIALLHDLLITAGVYALTGREVTSDTVAALLTILGYSLYDTIIVFDRVRENVPRMPRAAFSQVVNRSMSEVLTRSLATSFCTLLPVLALLLFGGATLKDFAFALLVGVASGAYSSIFIASPVLTHWKEREAGYRNRRARIMRELGMVPAYATAGGGAGADVAARRAAARAARLGAPLGGEVAPSLVGGGLAGEQISSEEFERLVADLDVGSGPGGPRRSRRDRGAVADLPEPGDGLDEKALREQDAQRDPRADLEPEDVVMPSQGKPAPGSLRRGRRRHGRKR